MAKTQAAVAIRDRVKSFTRIKASQLRPNEKNWREHPEEQRKALRGALEEIGFAGAVLAYEEAGELVCIDGHLRLEEFGDQDIPVLILDVNAEEAAKLLMTYDPIGALATTNQQQLDALLAEADVQNEALNNMLAEIASPAEGPVKLKQLKTPDPPKMSWLLVGIPTVRYGEIAETVEKLAGIEGIICETTINDG